MKESYRAMQLPQGTVPALGVLIKGGGFYCLINASAEPPVSGAATFTTVVDHQTEVAIKAMALLPGEATPLMIGSFELAGIPPAKACIPQINVMFDLDKDMVLTVTATDRQDAGRTKKIVIRDRIPTPPRLRQSAD